MQFLANWPSDADEPIQSYMQKNCVDKNIEFTPCFPGVDPPENYLRLHGGGAGDGVDPQTIS